MRGLYRSRLALAVASVASIVVAHVTIGFASGSLASGNMAIGAGSAGIHPAPGPAGTLLATAVLAALSVVVGLRLRMITGQAATHGSASLEPLANHLVRYASRAAGTWVHLFIVTGGLFLALEAGESALTGTGLLGSTQALTTELAIVLPAIAAATLLVAATRALADWCHCVLKERFVRITPRPHHPSGSAGTALHQAVVAGGSFLLAGDSSGRSPPPSLAFPA